MQSICICHLALLPFFFLLCSIKNWERKICWNKQTNKRKKNHIRFNTFHHFFGGGSDGGGDGPWPCVTNIQTLTRFKSNRSVTHMNHSTVSHFVFSRRFDSSKQRNKQKQKIYWIIFRIQRHVACLIGVHSKNVVRTSIECLFLLVWIVRN